MFKNYKPPIYMIRIFNFIHYNEYITVLEFSIIHVVAILQ